MGNAGYDTSVATRGEGYRKMIEGSVAKRAGTPDEVGAVGALLMGSGGGFITGSDFLMDGGVTASYWYGDVAEVRAAVSAGPRMTGSRAWRRGRS